MKIERCLESKKICLLNDEDNIILETERIGAEFVIIFYTNKPVIITKELDKSLYQNLNNLFENEYIFYKNLSYKNKNNFYNKTYINWYFLIYGKHLLKYYIKILKKPR